MVELGFRRGENFIRLAGAALRGPFSEIFIFLEIDLNRAKDLN